MIDTNAFREDHALRRYLLGGASAEESRMIERRILSDQEYFNRLLRAEEDLTDEYAGGRMPVEDREKFEQYFLSDPQRREGVQFAMALKKYADRTQSPAPSAGNGRMALRMPVKPVIAGAVLLVLAAAAFLLWGNRSAIERRKAEVAEAPSRNREKQTPGPQIADGHGPNSPAAGAMASLSLTPGLSRAAGAVATVTLSSSVQRLRLELRTDSRYRSYTAELQTVDGEVVWRAVRLRSHPTQSGDAVSVTLDTSLLSRSDYLAALIGEKADGSREKADTYYFRVIRE